MGWDGEEIDLRALLCIERDDDWFVLHCCELGFPCCVFFFPPWIWWGGLGRGLVCIQRARMYVCVCECEHWESSVCMNGSEGYVSPTGVTGTGQKLGG